MTTWENPDGQGKTQRRLRAENIDRDALELAGMGLFPLSDAEIDELAKSVKLKQLEAQYNAGAKPDHGPDDEGPGQEGCIAQAESPHHDVLELAATYMLIKATLRGNTEQTRAALSFGAHPDGGMYCQGSQRVPLVEAAKCPWPEVTELLLDAGANPDQATSNGENALSSAIRTNNYEVVKLLLTRGANPNWVSQEGATALSLAPASDVVKLLLDFGADPNVANSAGDLPIAAWIDGGDAESVALLVAAGTDLDRPNNAGKTARDMAKKSHNDAVRHAIPAQVGEDAPKEAAKKDGRTPKTLLVVALVLLIVFGVLALLIVLVLNRPVEVDTTVPEQPEQGQEQVVVLPPSEPAFADGDYHGIGQYSEGQVDAWLSIEGGAVKILELSGVYEYDPDAISHATEVRDLLVQDTSSWSPQTELEQALLDAFNDALNQAR